MLAELTSPASSTQRGAGEARKRAGEAARSARPGAGNPLGEGGEGGGGSAKGALLPHEVHEGVRRLDPEGTHLPRADQDAACQGDARTQRLRRDGRDAVGHLARPAGEVERALARDHEVRAPGPLGERDRRGDEVDAGLAGGSEDEQRVTDLLRTDAGFLGETLDTYGPDASIPQLELKYRLRRAMLDAERAAVLSARREGRYQEPAIVAALQAIDAEETALRAQFPREK